MLYLSPHHPQSLTSQRRGTWKEKTMSKQQHEPTVTEADVQAAVAYLGDAHNATQMLNACSQLRREVVIELAARGYVPEYFAA